MGILSNLMALSESTSENNVEKSKELLYKINNSNYLPTANDIGYAPLLTPKEMDDLGLDDDMNDEEKSRFNNYRRTLVMSSTYQNDLREAYADYIASGSDESERKLLHMGWIPSVEPTEKVFAKSSKKLLEYAKCISPTIYDVSGESDISILESIGKDKQNIVKKNGLRPVFLVCLNENSTIDGDSDIESMSYSHTSIGFNPELNELYSYTVDNGAHAGGLYKESLSLYIKNSSSAKILVLCIFVSESQYEKLEENIKWYSDNPDTSEYSIKNIFNVASGHINSNDRESISMISSQFVDSMLKMVNVDLTNNQVNKVTPGNIAFVKNPTVYKIYEGLASQYKESDTKRIMDNLSSTAEQVRSTVYESIGAENTASHAIVSYISKIMCPQSIFTEVNLPIQFNDNGDLEIDAYKSYEQKYQEVHTLLKSATDPNDIADCLCILWNANCNIEKKLQKMKRKKKYSDQYSSYVKLRSRILNDFNKYLKKLNSDTDISFYEYYKNSPYYDGSLKIKRSTLKNIGAYIKSAIG